MDISLDFAAIPADAVPIDEHPEAEALFERVDVLLAKQRPDDALWALVEATETAPHLWLTHYWYAALLISLGDDRSRDALPAAQRARELAPDIAATHNLVGLCLDARGDRRGAMESFARALEHDPGYVGAMNNLAFLDQRRWRLGRAGRRLTLVFEADDEFRAAWGNVVILTRRMALRLLAALVGSSAVLAVLLGLEVSDLVRAGVCVGLAVAVGVLASASWRALPPGPRVVAFRRLPIIHQAALAVPLTIAALTVLVMGLAPHDVAQQTGSFVLIVVIDLAILTVAGWFLLGWLRRFRR